MGVARQPMKYKLPGPMKDGRKWPAR